MVLFFKTGNYLVNKVSSLIISAVKKENRSKALMAVLPFSSFSINSSLDGFSVNGKTPSVILKDFLTVFFFIAVFLQLFYREKYAAFAGVMILYLHFIFLPCLKSLKIKNLKNAAYYNA